MKQSACTDEDSSPKTSKEFAWKEPQTIHFFDDSGLGLPQDQNGDERKELCKYQL